MEVLVDQNEMLKNRKSLHEKQNHEMIAQVWDRGKDRGDGKMERQRKKCGGTDHVLHLK